MDDATQTGLSVQLGAKTYHLSPLSDQDHADLDAWVQSKFIDNARRSLPDDAPVAVFDRVMTLAMREALGLTWMFAPGKNVMKTVAGHAMLAWLSARHRDPGASLAELTAALYDSKNLILLKKTLNAVHGFTDKQEAAKGSEGPQTPPAGGTSTPQ